MLVAALGSCVLVLGAGMGAASTAEPARVVMPPAVLDEEIATRDREQMETAFRDAIRRSGAEVIEPEGSGPCADERCLELARQQAGATHALGVKVELDSRDYAIHMVLVDARGRASLVDGTCELCGIDEAIQVVADQAAAFDRKLTVEVSAEVTVQSQPPGAQVIVDGELLGTTPLTVPVLQGEHRLRLQLPGYVVVDSTFVATPGTHESLSYGLAPALDTKPPVRGKWIAGWVLLGTGMTSLAGGGVFWGYHHQDVSPQCDDPSNRDVNGTCRYRYNSLAPALGLTLAGAAASITGAALIVVGRRREPGPGSLGVLLSPRSIGLRGRF